jgi:hypothetical protein
MNWTKRPNICSWAPVLASVFVLLASCLGQDRGGVDPKVALPILENILHTANVSGSIAYWGRCDSHKPYPDFPKLRVLPNYSGSPSEALRRAFVDDPKMQVTQEPGGMIRMVETDVPNDLLEVRIRHVSFGTPSPSPDMFNGPNNAMLLVLSAPEVKAFRRAHEIGPVSDRWIGPGNSDYRLQISGDLYDVTVSQALDYILQTYPGFWIYENCANAVGEGRTVFFGFF